MKNDTRTYTVLVREVIERKIDVEAETPDEAFNIICNGITTRKQPDNIRSTTVISSDGRLAKTINY